MPTRLIDLQNDPDPRARLDEAARCVADGGLVAFPTETVYGIACNRDDEAAVERLIEVKDRPPEKQFSVHIGSLEQVGQHVKTVPLVARRLMDRCWPGPLTIIIEARDGGTVGLRYPKNEPACYMIRKAGVPVIAPSANPSGQPPATDANMVMDYLDGKVDIVIDDGPTPFGKSSTVVRITRDGYELLREGALGPRSLQWAANKIILFVCTGNTCRSPLAEAICRKMLADRMEVKPTELVNHGYTVASAGIFAGFAQGASPEAVRVGREMGCDLSGHLTQRVTAQMLHDADVVYCMSRGHLENLLQVAPTEAGKMALLDPDGRDVVDPMGGDLDRYRRCGRFIRKALEQRLADV
ncbi:MAG: L-threonylcarbamoyladenylate synthase [Planctomycetota bacterium]